MASTPRDNKPVTFIYTRYVWVAILSKLLGNIRIKSYYNFTRCYQVVIKLI